MTCVLIFLEKSGGIYFCPSLKNALINNGLQKVFHFFIRFSNQNFSIRKLVRKCYFFLLKKTTI